MHLWRKGKGVDRSAYPSDQQFFDDLSAVFREEITSLAAAGCTYIQLDDVPLTMLCDENVRSELSQAGMSPDQLLDDYTQLFNDCLRDRPDTVTAAIHLCRGNYKGHFLSEGGYEVISEKMFNEIDADAFFMEYDTAQLEILNPSGTLQRTKLLSLELSPPNRPN